MLDIKLITPKGGQGSTTLAAAIALALAERGERAHLCGDPLDITATLGVESIHARAPRERLTIGGPGSHADPVSLDATAMVQDLGAVAYRPTHATLTVLVVRNCYVALRRAMMLRDDIGATWDVVATVCEPNRALDHRDVADVLGGRCIDVGHDPAVTRSVDAGLLIARRPARLIAGVGEILDAAVLAGIAVA